MRKPKTSKRARVFDPGAVYLRAGTFRAPDGNYYVTLKGRDDAGNEVELAHHPLDSREGKGIWVAAINQVLGGDWPSDEEIRESIATAKGMYSLARRREPTLLPPKAERSSSGPDTSEEPSDPAQGATEPPLPAAQMKIRLDTRGKLVADLCGDGRTLPFNHLSVRAELYAILEQHLGHSPTAAEIAAYQRRCCREALREYRTMDEIVRTDYLEYEELLTLVVGLMAIRHHNRKGPFVAPPAKLLETLEALAFQNYIDTTAWPKGRHFYGLLTSSRDRLRERGIELRYTRAGGLRKYTLDWLPGAEIPSAEGWEVPVGAASNVLLPAPGTVLDIRDEAFWQANDEAARRRVAAGHEARQRTKDAPTPERQDEPAEIQEQPGPAVQELPEAPRHIDPGTQEVVRGLHEQAAEDPEVTEEKLNEMIHKEDSAAARAETDQPAN